MIRSAAVVVPVHDEEATLPACLAALTAAAGEAPVPVSLLAVLDRCADASAGICAVAGVPTLSIDAANVGRARRAGMAAVAAAAAHPLEELWLATTDADSVVPPGWLTDQIHAADRGVDAHVGTVELAQGELTGRLHRRLLARYHQWAGEGSGAHPHVHGANLGVRASAYTAVGGFPAVPVHEDRLLVERLETQPTVVVRRSAALPVLTSTRSRGRAPGGVAADVLRLLTDDEVAGTPVAGAGAGTGETAATGAPGA